MRLVGVVGDEPLAQPSHGVEAGRLRLAKLAQGSSEEAGEGLGPRRRGLDEGRNILALGDDLLVFDCGEGGRDEGAVGDGVDVDGGGEGREVSLGAGQAGAGDLRLEGETRGRMGSRRGLSDGRRESVARS